MFAKGSRYESVADATYQAPSGREISYKRLRLITTPPSFQTHMVVVGDRLDLLAFHHFRDPLQFWRIADANEAMLPEELTRTPGRRVRIPMLQR